MLKMILTVPRNFDAQTFCDIATSIVRDETENEYERKRGDYDCELGIFLNRHFVKDNDGWGTFNYYNLKNSEVYEVNADFVDMAHIVALMKLQKLCPQVDFHFENSGNGKNDSRYYSDFDNPIEFKELFGNLI